jgi:hypothetical protein
MDELKPCPFCGGEAFSREYDEQRPDEPYGLVVYHAPACFLAPHADHSGFEARWNTRSPVTDEMVEKAAAAMFNLRMAQRGTPNITFDQCVILRPDWIELATAALSAIGEVDHG